MGELTTDQGDLSTCSVHALTKAVRQSQAEQSLNIELKNCLASFLIHPKVDERERELSMVPKSPVLVRKISSGLARLICSSGELKT